MQIQEADEEEDCNFDLTEIDTNSELGSEEIDLPIIKIAEEEKTQILIDPSSRTADNHRIKLMRMLTNEKIWLTPQEKPKQYKTAIIFDWDDTVLPSTWVHEQGLRLDEGSHYSWTCERVGSLGLYESVLKNGPPPKPSGNQYFSMCSTLLRWNVAGSVFGSAHIL